ncbi:diguanylate cyclase [Treponema primitia]|uniref:diguanylate cyclase domain-containing protein n=1 Tax=Treponema primitia TaxID=88058 RepID=UPI003980FFB3
MEPTQEFRILVIDDEKSNLMVLNRILSPEYTVFTAKTGKEGLERAVADQPDLILLDIVMPDLNGFDVLTTFKKTPETMKIPVIIITGLSGETDEERGFLLGAVDYITKPFKNPIVLARVRTHIQIVHQIRTIEQLGLIDGLTNVPNRRCFDDRMALEWRRAAREKNPVSFLMMDVDKFKTYNDTYGHPQGDVLLKSIAKIFSAAAMRTTDLVARLGGEEFGILLPDTDLAAALIIAEKIRSGVEAVRIPTADGKTITTVTISIGAVSAVPDDKATVQEFLSAADKRLYTAKNTGRNRICSED